MEQSNDEFEINLVELFYVLRSKLLLIILTAAIFGIGAGVYTHYFVTPMYSSSSSIYVLSKQSIVSYSDFMVGSSLTSDYTEMIKSSTVMERVIRNLGLKGEFTADSLRSCVSISNPTDTRMLNITAVNKDPRIAKAIVDEVAEVSVERIKEIMNVEQPNIYETGRIATNPISPNLKKNVFIAGLFGAVLAAAIFIILYLMNDSIQSPEDVEKYLGLNVLAAIPVEEGSKEQIRIDERKRLGKRK